MILEDTQPQPAPKRRRKIKRLAIDQKLQIDKEQQKKDRENYEDTMDPNAYKPVGLLTWTAKDLLFEHKNWSRFGGSLRQMMTGNLI